MIGSSFAPVKLTRRVNFLQYGDATDVLSPDELGELPSVHMEKSAMIDHLRQHRKCNRFVEELITHYHGTDNDYLSMPAFRRDLAQTRREMRLYRRMGCRGFSCKCYSGVPGFPYDLRAGVNLRLVLAADRNLFYPAVVREFLAQNEVNHFFAGESPAISFALGVRTADRCLLLAMQSDVASKGPAAVRDHFRGWRKVLLTNIVHHLGRHTEILMMPRAFDVSRACHTEHPASARALALWESIYDSTAQGFGFVLTELSRPANLQLYADQPPVLTRLVWAANVAGLVRQVTDSTTEHHEILPDRILL